MTDPAVEAARQARMDGRSTHVQRVAAAREALKPIRELHFKYVSSAVGAACSQCIDHHGDPAKWPCETAKLIYSTEELQSWAAR